MKSQMVLDKNSSWWNLKYWRRKSSNKITHSKNSKQASNPSSCALEDSPPPDSYGCLDEDYCRPPALRTPILKKSRNLGFVLVHENRIVTFISGLNLIFCN